MMTGTFLGKYKLIVFEPIYSSKNELESFLAIIHSSNSQNFAINILKIALNLKEDKIAAMIIAKHNIILSLEIV